MSLLNQVENKEQEQGNNQNQEEHNNNNFQEHGDVTNNDVSDNQEDINNQNEVEKSKLEQFKEYLGEEYNDKYENLYNKFLNEEGNLDEFNLLKSYRNLEKSFSEKRGAPEEGYKVEYNEDIEEDFQFKEDDGLMNNFTETAKELGLSNEQYNGIVNMMAGFVKEETQNAQKQQEEQEKQFKDQISKIENFKERAVKIDNYLKSNLDENGYKQLKSSITSEDGMKAIETLMQKSKDHSINPKPNTIDFDSGEDKLEKLISEKNKAFQEGNYDKAERIKKELNKIMFS